MRQDALLTALQHPRGVSLSNDTWEAVAVLAGLRQAVNDPIRAGDRDRGNEKNWLADTWGVLGELVALRRLNDLTSDPIAHHPIDFDRSVDDVDLTIDTGEGLVRIEAKAHLLEPGKAWFMVNQRARDRSTRRRAIGYLPILSALGAKKAIIGRLIALEQLATWPAPTVTLRDPAVGIRVEQLANEYLDARLDDLHDALKSEAIATRGRLSDIAQRAAHDVATWQARLTGIERLTATQVVQRIRDAQRQPPEQA